jgi:hypothetical protein
MGIIQDLNKQKIKVKLDEGKMSITREDVRLS